jgi:ATP phosphoribosyltransferase regulatory subunit
MRNSERWLLPEGVEEILPPEAERLEALRRRVLDRLRAWGYEMVVPPFVEHLDALLTGMGHDLDLQTFKLTDPESGRLLGVRADMTPQVARIDAHRLRRDTPTRLCYIGTVLHTHATLPGGSRSPLQLGAELYGHAGIESDVEVLCLMSDVLMLAGVRPLCLDIGHIGIFRGLTRKAGLDTDQEMELFSLLQRKAVPEIADCTRTWRVAPSVRDMLLALTKLNGGIAVLTEARRRLRAAGAPVLRALEDLRRIARLLKRRLPEVALHFDLAELRGYHYHTGVMFAAYHPGEGRALAWGGRYDNIGRVFGRARPATGFSLDLLRLLRRQSPARGTAGHCVLAPAAASDAALHETIAALRRRGTRVIMDLPGKRGEARVLGCTHKLVRRRGRWRVVKF